MAEQTHGITLELRHEAFDQMVARLREVTDDLSDMGAAIATILENSVRQNFEEGGRPTRWAMSARARKQGGQTLRDRDALYNAITSEFDAAAGGVRTGLRVGANVPYAAAHHFGVRKTVTQHVREHVARRRQAFGKPIPETVVTVRAHTRNMRLNLPARPYMMMQDEDWEDIRDLVQDAIEEAMR